MKYSENAFIQWLKIHSDSRISIWLVKLAHQGAGSVTLEITPSLMSFSSTCLRSEKGTFLAGKSAKGFASGMSLIWHALPITFLRAAGRIT